MHHPTRSAGSEAALVALCFLTGVLLAAVALLALLNTSTTNYDWDLDTEMYFGWRTTQGELIWTREFHDKFPIVSYVFTIPALLGSISIWLFVSTTITLITSAAISFVGYRLSVSAGLLPGFAGVIGFLAGSLYLFLIATSPGGIATINAVATGLSTSACAILLRYWPETVKLFRVRIITLAVALLALSISIRPYFAAPAAIMVVFVTLFPRQSTVRMKKERTLFPDIALATGTRTLPILLTLAALTMLINALPYILTGQGEVFFSGLQVNAQDLNPRSSASSIVEGLGFREMVFWLQFLMLLTVPFMAMKLRWSFLPQQLALALAMVSLLVIILRTHWWQHYYSLFSGLIALQMMLVAVSLASIWRSRIDFTGSFLRWTVLVSFLIPPPLVLALTSARTELNATSYESQQGLQTHPDEAIVNALIEFFDVNHKERPSFFYPHSSYVHWKLSEPRHGMPHAAHTDQIINGWWDGVTIPDQLRLPTSLEAYCGALNEAPIDNLVLDTDSPIHACTRSASGPWGAPRIVMTATGTTLHIFERS